MSNDRIPDDLELLDSGNITGAQNILLQGIRNLSLAKSFAAVSNSSAGGRLKLLLSPPSLPVRIKIQAMVECKQTYPYWDTDKKSPERKTLTFQTVMAPPTVNTGSLFTSLERLVLHQVTNLEFDIKNHVELDIEIAEPYIAKEFFAAFRGWFNTATYSSDIQIQIFSITLDTKPIGCEGIQVRSLDGRLVSNTHNKILTLPILFLGRDPVREDAQHYKEVLVFQDRATTIRVMPQPLVLNEDNGYSANGTVVSNGNWALYDYDMEKLLCRLESGMPVAMGSGNDILRILINPSFRVYGLYDLVLLFVTDTSSESYPVPVVLDYAVPLTVNGQPRLVTIKLGDRERETTLTVLRDRLWKIVGFPEEYFTVGTREGIASTYDIPLKLKEDYSELGAKVYTFTVQSGSKRVMVRVEVDISFSFAVGRIHNPRSYLILEPSNHYQETIYVLRKGYGTWTEGAASLTILGRSLTESELGYRIPGVADYAVEWQSSSSVCPVDLISVSPASTREPLPGTMYDEFFVQYIGDRVTAPAGGLGSDSYSDNVTIRFIPSGNTTGPSVNVYRNIELNFIIEGHDNRPAPDGTGRDWKIERTVEKSSAIDAQGMVHYEGPEINPPNSVYGYLTPAVSANLTYPFTLKANQEGKLLDADGAGFSHKINGLQANSTTSSEYDYESGQYVTSTFASFTYDQVKSGTSLTAESASEYLNKRYRLIIQFASYRWYYDNPAAASTSPSFKEIMPDTIILPFEVRTPHFLKVNNVYLQWDNSWTQHHWLRTNPDAVISIVRSTGGLLLSLTHPSPYTSGDYLLKLVHEQMSHTYIDLYTVHVKSTVPNSIGVGTWLSSPVRDTECPFTVIVYHPTLIRNEIIPPMAAANREINIADQEIASSIHVSRYQNFNRNNREDTAVAASGLVRNKTDYVRPNREFAVIIFDHPRIIRSWSYTVSGRTNIACGFLIEGWLDGVNQWEAISAVTDYDTHSGSYDSQETIVIDYITVAPKPWDKIRITVTQVRNQNGSLVTPTGTLNGNFRVGQFQFYEGYPVLKRVSSVEKGSTSSPRQLNTYSGSVRYIIRSSDHIAVSVSDGKLFSVVELSGSSYLDGIDTANYNSTEYWHYRLVDTSTTLSNLALMPFNTDRACLGLNLASAIQVIGIRYDTSIVSNYSTAGAIVVETSSQDHTTANEIFPVNNCEPLALVSAWRYLGQGYLPNMDSLELNAAAETLNNFVKKAQELIFGQEPTDAVVNGTMVLRVDQYSKNGGDYRILRYENGVWENIGQDIIMDTGSTPLPANLSPAALNEIACTWMNVGALAALRDKIAFTNPTDKERWVYTANSSPDQWKKCGKYRFDIYRGKQYYRNVHREGVKSIRVYIPGLVDTDDIRQGSKQIRAIVGEIQFFEQFRGGDVTYKDIRVNGHSVKYADSVVVESSSSAVTIQCDGLTVDGKTAPANSLYAQMRQSTSLDWRALSQTGISSLTLESNYTVTSVTLFYRQGTMSAARMYPFFTFTLVRQ
jgi:hypothetical protein